MRSTPLSERLHIGLFGRRNVGKSSLINLLTGQEAALVSPVAGTTTDPVRKAMELLPLGPVVFIDTAGLDDEGDLGRKRIASTGRAMRRTDLALAVFASTDEPGAFEEKLIEDIKEKQIPVIGVINKIDTGGNYSVLLEWLEKKGIPCVPASAVTGEGRLRLLEAIVAARSETEKGPSIVEGVIGPGETAVLVVPIDTGAPKGRLILPQVQTMRDILDHGGQAVAVTVEQLEAALDDLVRPPKIVITDSQAFGPVSQIVPAGMMLTSFSVLFARYKGRLAQLAEGASAIQKLGPGDQVLVAEGCTHHSREDDIGRVKIPRWLDRACGGPLRYSYAVGCDFPQDMTDVKLVVHCGACMLNRREMLYRLNYLKQRGLPVVNYGILIAYVHGILEKVLEPFPEALARLDEQGGAANDLP